MGQKKTFLQKLGLDRQAKLTPALCRERVTFLKKQIKAGKYEGKLLERAKYYANWYAWAAENRVKESTEKRKRAAARARKSTTKKAA